MRIASMEAYAKINLTLDITGTRPDGYHLLRSVMQSVSLSDTITVELNDSDNSIDVLCTVEDVPTDEENIAHKAARLFFEGTGVTAPPGVRITIDKRIPMQAGLGGGSADAAAVLKLLNELCAAGLGKAELAEIGLKAGADVPFCVAGGTCLAEGIGEQLKRLPPLPDCFILLAKPQAGANTKDIFKRYDAAPSVRQPSYEGLINALERGKIDEACIHIGNTLEGVTAAIVPEIRQLKSVLLENGALAAAMTGSGSAVFGVFDDEAKWKACKINLENIEGVTTFLCHPINV